MPKSLAFGVNTNILKDVYENANTPEEREHVTFYIRSHPNDFKILNFNSGLLNQDIRLTIDTIEDFKLMNSIYNNLGDLDNLTSDDVIEFLKNNPNLCKINEKVQQKNPEIPKKNKLAVITDGDSKIGLGHVYRSLTLAKELKKYNDIEIYFLTRSDETILRKIEDEGFIGINFVNDEEIKDLLKEFVINTIIMDRLDFNEEILKTIKKDTNTKIVLVENSNLRVISMLIL